VTRIYSVADMLPADTPLVRQWPSEPRITPFRTQAWLAAAIGPPGRPSPPLSRWSVLGIYRTMRLMIPCVLLMPFSLAAALRALALRTEMCTFYLACTAEAPVDLQFTSCAPHCTQSWPGFWPAAYAQTQSGTRSAVPCVTLKQPCTASAAVHTKKTRRSGQFTLPVIHR